ncbi:hypothetical protein LINGRAHAP2_LOCUS34783 [Linum grandiflorum]
MCLLGPYMLQPGSLCSCPARRIVLAAFFTGSLLGRLQNTSCYLRILPPLSHPNHTSSFRSLSSHAVSPRVLIYRCDFIAFYLPMLLVCCLFLQVLVDAAM